MRALLVPLLALAALPALADNLAPDPGRVSCRDLIGMTERQRITVAMAAKEAMAGDSRLQSMSDEDVLKLAVKACSARPGASLLQAIKD